MRQRIVFILLMLLCVNFINATDCACGSFETGTVEYAIVDPSPGVKPNCCRDGLTGKAYQMTWARNAIGTYTLVDIVEIKPVDAQKKCCESV